MDRLIIRVRWMLVQEWDVVYIRYALISEYSDEEIFLAYCAAKVLDKES